VPETPKVDDADIQLLFDHAAAIGEQLSIELQGAEAVTPLLGYERDDYRTSDAEFIIHELAHAAVEGKDMYWLKKGQLKFDNDSIHELMAIAITLKVLESYLGPAIVLEDFIDTLAVSMREAHTIEAEPIREMNKRQLTAWVTRVVENETFQLNIEPLTRQVLKWLKTSN
jgi:hypothetical protein